MLFCSELLCIELNLAVRRTLAVGVFVAWERWPSPSVFVFILRMNICWLLLYRPVRSLFDVL